jgi:phosphoribosylaminoimidazolecarboxamide formyltransferase/IMP cyclohydrolase
MSDIKIKSALISVYDKKGLDAIVPLLIKNKVEVYSTGGTYDYLEKLGIQPLKVGDLTGYPSILGGRVKTLHPKVFGGILAKREEDHLNQLEQYSIPAIDLVVVDLYPFEDTLRATEEEAQIIEKIDIGGISLIRAAAKNYRHVLTIASKEKYGQLEQILSNKDGVSDLEERKSLAAHAFAVSSHYDTAIFNYFNSQLDQPLDQFRYSVQQSNPLRYGENPHQSASYHGDWSELFSKLSGKDLSYNNLVDIDAAIQIMSEFRDAAPTFAILKHTNACGLATRGTCLEAWKDALAGDPVSAFGGILIANKKIDIATAEEINKLFYEVLIAPGFDEEALVLLTKKKKRILLLLKDYPQGHTQFKSLLNGMIRQDIDRRTESVSDLKTVSEAEPSNNQMLDLLFANKIAKHLKSNTIVLVKNAQLLGMGCGQTSRVDACKQAIEKAGRMGFKLEGAVMASDAFFPFPDCVELAHDAGIQAVIQPGGSINDQLSIDFCDKHNMTMVTTGVRHFKH